MIPVTKAFLPPKEEYQIYLDQIWESGWLTNNGVLVQELEKKLAVKLGVKHCIYATNGTIAIQIALKALGITKEVITTPYSYVATTNSLLWEGCTPVFVDIDSTKFALDPKLIENAITEKTEAILATHCYGIPCDIDAIQKIADKHNLKVIYDAAHAFGVEINGNSILNYGEISTLSFHSTKLFHTVEGGAIVCNDDALAEEIKLIRSFGHKGDDYYCLGINGKNSEFHAAMGHAVLPFINDIVDARRRLYHRYDGFLRKVNRFDNSFLEELQYNFAYYPFVFESEAKLFSVLEKMKEQEIFPRRYFFPSLNKLPFVNGADCPISESISKRVVCLPLYFDLEEIDVDRISNIILSS